MCMDVYTCTCFQNLPDSPARIDFSGQANFSGFYQKDISLNTKLDVCWFAILGISLVKSEPVPLHRGQGVKK